MDEYGRVRIFHGLNRVQKGYPWYYPQLLNEDHLDNLQRWGFNVVRLGMMWSGVEIKPYVVNTTYLDVMEKIVKSLSDRGIYVILDMHQDAISTLTGSSYDGAPLWLVEQFKQQSPKFPWPFSKPPSNWMLNYVTGECGDAFHSLYNNEAGAVDHVKFFWKTVAKRFGKYDNVLGYELINEPWPGNVVKDPLLFVPGEVGTNILQPFYDKIFSAINDVDNTTMIFYEPVTWGMILHGDKFGSGFHYVPGGDTQTSRGVLSFHYYCWFAGTYDQNPFPWWLRNLCDKMFFPDVLKSVAKDVGDTGGSLFLTEFGLCQATAPKSSTEYQECLSVLSTSDSVFLSWTYWDSQFYYPNGSVIDANAMLFSRTYPQAIAGDPIFSQFDSDTGRFVFSYIPKPSIKKPTVVFVSPLHYPNGFNVQVTAASYKIVNNNYVEITPSSHPNIITVDIGRK